MTKSAPRGSKSPPISAFDAACRSLARRRLTEAEVRQRLEKKYQPSEIAEAVIKLKEYHFIDDDALIVDYIKDRLNLSPRSVRMMQYELLRRGIAQEHFQRIFEQEFPDHDEVEAARQALKSRLKRLQSAPPQSRRERALRFLHSRGFNFEVINQVWGEVIDGFNENDPDS